ncbi:MAG: CbiX/SirB N-terminal domain-containing protein [Burkholderiaceae bacterium]|jgi:sirohydrochlorin cobaltochelatase|nr:CbiX/SirB N-terminal domain-containing protein [Burkholderiaceae bacterium]
MSAPDGVVLFAHGSRDPTWCAPIEAVAARMRTLDPGAHVICAYLDLTSPDLSTAVQILHAANVRAVTVWPMFVGAGRHARGDLPRLIDELRMRYADMRFTLQPAIAEHPAVLDVMARTALWNANGAK